MSEIFTAVDSTAAVRRASRVLVDQADYFTELDQAIGDGDMGITMRKVGTALQGYADETEPGDDLGGWLAKAGMTANRAGPSTMGTLLATALMRAGKAIKGKAELSADDVVEMFRAADQGIQERGKAKPGDKTIIDALHPAAEAFAAAVEKGDSLATAGQMAINAAAAGRDSVTPLRSKVGRAGWVGERTEGKVDPGCAMAVLVLESLVAGEE